jgi:Family of unknown function (DUF5522)
MTDRPADDTEIARAHAAAIAAGEAGYLDPETGYFVFTAATLAANGSCCDRGCRHCPWRSSAAGL